MLLSPAIKRRAWRGSRRSGAVGLGHVAATPLRRGLGRNAARRITGHIRAPRWCSPDAHSLCLGPLSRTEPVAEYRLGGRHPGRRVALGASHAVGLRISINISVAKRVVCSTSRPFGHATPKPIGTRHEPHHRPRLQGRARRRPGAASQPHRTVTRMPMTRQSSLKTIRVGRVLTMSTRSADPAMRKVYRRDGTTRAACLSIRGQSTPTPTTTARTWAVTPDRPRQSRPSAFELGPFGAYGWRGGAGASRGIVYGWLTGAGCVLRGADPSHRVKLGFVFLTCVLSVFSGQ